MKQNIILFTLCILPSLCLMYYIYNKDKVEKEPFYILFLLFLEGCVVGILSLYFTKYLKTVFTFLNLNYNQMNFFQIIIKNFIFMAIIEECLKWIFTYFTIWKNENFNHMYDGIVYSCFLSLGFAFIENVIYMKYYTNISILILRSFISVPSHLAFAVFMGYNLALSKQKGNKTHKLYSILYPVLLHFLYNMLLYQENVNYILFSIYLLLLFYISYIFINKYSTFKKGFIKNKKGI